MRRMHGWNVLESNMRRTVIKLLKPLHAVSVENGICHPGTPDVNCTLGWIELKATEAWPVRPTTIVRLDHDLNDAQRIWLTKRRKAGGGAWVMLTVGRDWLLFDGEVAARILGRVTRSDLEAATIAQWKNTPNQSDLIECLTLTKFELPS